jgi:hypothetical protein
MLSGRKAGSRGKILFLQLPVKVFDVYEVEE